MIKLPDIKNPTKNFIFQFMALLSAVFLFAGKPVPYSNEFNYLLRLKQVYDPGYLINDITFATPTNEYWLFDHLFGLLTFFLSIEAVGWIGRIACWSVLLFALMKLGKRWEISGWMISFSIFIWLCIGQSIIADEWMFGGFEAKCVAYICLIFALDRFCDEKDISAAILLGLSFSFHPIVGLWGIAAAIPALLIWQKDFLKVLKVGIISGSFSLIGAIPLLQMAANSVVPTTENLKFFELVKFQHHFDPFSWSRSAVLLVCILMVFCVIVHTQIKRSGSPRFLLTFLTILFVFFVFGFLLRSLSQYELMKYTPTRLFAVFIPLFFLFYLAGAYQNDLLKKPLQVAVLLPIIFLSLWNKLPMRGFEQARSTFSIWNQKQDDLAQAFVWLKNNTPKDTLVIAPPWRYDFWYLSERAEIVNYRKPVISDVGEWQTRLELLIGEPNPADKVRDEQDFAKFYYAIDREKIDSLAKKYGAGYFVSTSDYSYEIVHSNGSVKVYRFDARDETSSGSAR